MEQNNPHQNQTFMSIRELTISGLLAGITIFLGLTGYGFIPLVVMNATILHIPTIIGTVVAGPKVGILVGFLFGLFSFIQTLRAQSLMMQFALQYSVIADAFICIVPRICIPIVHADAHFPIVVWLLYKYIPGNAHLRAGISAVGGAITNTVLFLGSFFLLVGAPYAAAKGISVEAVGLMIMGIVTANGIPEALVSGVIVVPIVMALKKAGWKMK